MASVIGGSSETVSALPVILLKRKTSGQIATHVAQALHRYVSIRIDDTHFTVAQKAGPVEKKVE
jgi:hypothetical protein